MSDTSSTLALGLRTWGRRALTVSFTLLFWLLLLVGFPLLIIVAAITDMIRGGAWVLARGVVFFTFYFCCEVIGIVMSFVIWLASGVWMRRSRARFLRWNFELQQWWANTLARGAMRIFDLRIEVEGTDDLSRGPVIIFMRHASAADTLLPAMFISSPHGLRLRYVLKHELLLDPCLDIVGNRLPNTFVRSGAGDSFRVQRLMEGLGPRDGVIIYPEGSRFRRAKLERILAQMAEKDAALYKRARGLRHVLPPRLGGPLGLLEHNQSADVIFCAHAGFDGVVDLRDFLRGALIHRTVRVRFWRVPFAAIPKTRAAQLDWLFAHWSRIDEWVGRELGEQPTVASAD